MALRLRDVAATSNEVAATSSKKAKVEALAALFRQADADELPVVATLLAGTPRQGRIGVGWATLAAVERTPPGPGGEITVVEFDRLLDELAALSGEGSTGARVTALGAQWARADQAEREVISQLLLGGLRQGALEGLTIEALALATTTSAAVLRRGLMLAGELGPVARAAGGGGDAAVRALRLKVGRPLRPMLAATSADVSGALADLGLVSIEWKLDGARVQVHRDGADVAIFTRNLNDVTARLPEVVALVRALPAERLVLDGEVIGLSEAQADGGADAVTPRLFQDTISRFAAEPSGGGQAGWRLSPFFFDCLHLDGQDLLDEPLSRRLEALDQATGRFAVPRLLTEDPAAAEAFAADALSRGHEGVMVKALEGGYAAGRRGASWRKVKPVRLFDLVVLAAEWGHGRRQGWLSNLHLGARDPAQADRFVMVGKTFKGLTDQLLRWQTEALLARQSSVRGITVSVRPELVVEIALDGVQRSTRYPGGVALRFARVRRYRPDKSPGEADTIDALRALLPDGSGATVAPS